jgi:GntR family transcriptional regulator
MVNPFDSRKRDNPIPSYYKLQMYLKAEIENKRWAPGESIPTEKQLAETHQVSIGTVKKAVLNLVHDGYLYRTQGKGTFVAGTTLRRESLRYYRFLSDFEDTQADLEVKLLGIEKTDGFQPVNRYLKIRSNMGLYKVDRLFLFEKKPLVFTISYLPHSTFKGLDEYPVSLFEKETLYQAIEDKYGITTVYNRKLCAALNADAEIAGKLEIDSNLPVMFIEMLSYTYKDAPYEYRKSYCVTQRKKIFIEI